MPIQGSGEIKFSQIASQFGRSLANGISMKLCYRGGGIVPDISENSNVPNSGEIKFSRFFAARQGVGDGTFVYRDIRFDADGWAITGQFLAETSRIVYISNTGDDTLAANNQHGRGYYLYNDDEIGADPTQPIGEVYAYQTIAAAESAARYTRGLAIRTTANPDWILYKRGDTFDYTIFDVNARDPVATSSAGGTATNARRVFAAYGNIALPRPKIIIGNGINIRGFNPNSWPNIPTTDANKIGNFAFMSLEILSNRITASGYGFGITYEAHNIFVEDVKTSTLGASQPGNSIEEGGVVVYNPYSAKNLFFRRCVVVDTWNPEAHNQGVYVSAGAGNTTISECLFDMNGYKEDVTKPATWSGAPTVNQDQVSNTVVGEGVQPMRTFFDHNCYLSSYDELLFENNIVSRGGGGASVQTRTGGVARGNFFIWNHIALASGHPMAARDKSKNFTAENNLILHDDALLPEGGFGQALYLAAGSTVRTNTASAIDNLILHFHERSNGAGLLTFQGNPFYDAVRPESRLTLGRAFRNTIVQFHNGANFAIGLYVDSIEVGQNDFLSLDASNAAMYNYAGGNITQAQARAGAQYLIGNNVTGGNHYYVPNWSSYATTWQGAGKDTQSTRYTSVEQMATARGWSANAVNEDIVTYMQSLDPSYVPDEEMTVDDFVQVASEDRRPNAPKLWYVLRNPSLYAGTSGNVNGGQFPPTDAQAKLIARRCHAFNYFMSFARENRKGNWNSDYTAKAINNYFRPLFNKTLV